MEWIIIAALAIITVYALRKRKEEAPPGAPPAPGAAILKGQVKGADGAYVPLVGALVDVGGMWQGTTEDRGWFRIEDIGPGTYTVTVSASGYSTREWTVTLSADQELQPPIFLLTAIAPAKLTLEITGKMTTWKVGFSGQSSVAIRNLGDMVADYMVKYYLVSPAGEEQLQGIESGTLGGRQRVERTFRGVVFSTPGIWVNRFVLTPDGSKSYETAVRA